MSGRIEIKVDWDLRRGLLPWQDRVLNESKRFNVLVKGRRCGGTALSEDLAIDALLDGWPVGWFSATYKILAEAERELLEAIGPLILKSDKQQRHYTLRNGATIEMWSLEGKVNARSRKYKRVIVDEAAHVDDLKQAWEKEIRATLMDYRGDAWFPTSPNGHNYLHTLWEKGQDPASIEWMSWQIPSWENPTLEPDEIESAKRDTDESGFRQEWGAEFVTRSGAVFGDFSRSLHVRECPYDPALPVHMGVDFGYRVFAACIFQIDKLGVVRIIGDAEYREMNTQAAMLAMYAIPLGNGRPYHEHVEIIGCDPAGDARSAGAEVAGWTDVSSVRKAWPRATVKTSSDPKHRSPEWRASQIRALLKNAAGETRLVIDPSCKRTIRMFENSVYPEHKDGKPMGQEPVKDGVVDHVRDALGYGLVNTRVFGRTGAETARVSWL